MQTLVLANSIHRPHSQISTRILSLSCFTSLSKQRPLVVNPHLIGPPVDVSFGAWFYK